MVVAEVVADRVPVAVGVALGVLLAVPVAVPELVEVRVPEAVGARDSWASRHRQPGRSFDHLSPSTGVALLIQRGSKLWACKRLSVESVCQEVVWGVDGQDQLEMVWDRIFFSVGGKSIFLSSFKNALGLNNYSSFDQKYC